MYHVLVSDGISFICMTEEALGRRIPFAFLEDVTGRFFAAYSASCREVRSAGVVTWGDGPAEGCEPRGFWGVGPLRRRLLGQLVRNKGCEWGCGMGLRWPLPQGCAAPEGLGP